jgi:hypothetical protein
MDYTINKKIKGCWVTFGYTTRPCLGFLLNRSYIDVNLLFVYVSIELPLKKRKNKNG